MSAGLAAIDPADLLRLFGKAPLGAPQGFSGTSGTIVSPEEPAPEPVRAAPGRSEPELAGLASGIAPLPPTRPDDAALSAAAAPAGADRSTPVVPQADRPAPGAVPVMGQAPSAGLAAPALAAGALGASPAAGSGAAAPAAPASAAEPSFGDRFLSGAREFRASGGFDYLGNIGAGLLASPTWAGGLAAGTQLAQKGEVQRAATDLARAEYGLKANKLRQETARENQTAKVIATKLGIPLEQAAAFAGNTDFVNSFLRNSYGMPEGYTRNADGSLSPISGGEKDPATIRGRAQAAAEGAAAGAKDDVQLVTQPNGSIVAVNKSRLGEAGAAPAATTVMPGTSKLAHEVEERRQAVITQGHDPKDPRYADFIVSGSLPKENQQQLTAADKQAIREGEDSILSHRNAVGQLRRALDLSPKAYEGVTAGPRATIMTNLPAMLGGGSEAAMATREFDNLMSTQMLDSLKAIFGGNPTEGERAALKDIQGISSMPQELREKVIRNTIAKVESRLGFEEQRVGDLRGGTYYKPRTGDATQPQSRAGAEPAPTDPMTAARAAISQGADPAKVKTRLLKMGIDPKGL